MISIADLFDISVICVYMKWIDCCDMIFSIFFGLIFGIIVALVIFKVTMFVFVFITIILFGFLFGCIQPYQCISLL